MRLFSAPTKIHTPKIRDHRDAMTNPNTIEIELLVLDAQAGNTQALTALAQRYNTTLTRRAIALTKNPDAAADITQDTWLVIARSIRSLRDPARFHAWANSILANHARDWIKAQIKQRHSRTNSQHNLNHHKANPADEQDIRLAIMSLDPKLRDIIILIYMDRCTIEQAAAALAIPTGTAKSRLRKAREQLRNQIEPTERT